jgi:hypothetical protein
MVEVHRNGINDGSEYHAEPDSPEGADARLQRGIPIEFLTSSMAHRPASDTLTLRERLASVDEHPAVEGGNQIKGSGGH